MPTTTTELPKRTRVAPRKTKSLDNIASHDDVDWAQTKLKVEQQIGKGIQDSTDAPDAKVMLAYRSKNRRETIRRSRDTTSYKPLQTRADKRQLQKQLDDAPWQKEGWNEQEKTPEPEPEPQPQPEPEPEPKPEPLPEPEPEPEPPKIVKKPSIADRYLAVTVKEEKEDEVIKSMIGEGYEGVKKWTPLKPDEKQKKNSSTRSVLKVEKNSESRPREFLPLRGPAGPGGSAYDLDHYSGPMALSREDLYPSYPCSNSNSSGGHGGAGAGLMYSPVEKIKPKVNHNITKVNLKPDDWVGMGRDRMAAAKKQSKSTSDIL